MPEIIPCPACGKEVSDQAAACPHCGQPAEPKSKPKKKTPIFVRFLQISLVVIAAVYFISDSDDEPSAPTGLANTGDIVLAKPERLNIRSGPSTNDEIVTTVNVGSELLVITEADGWLQVGVVGSGGLDGWVRNDLVTNNKPAPAQKKPAPDNKDEGPSVVVLEALIRQVAKDPDSIQFRNRKWYSNSVCVDANAKNSFGGYVGFKTYCLTNDDRISIDGVWQN